MIRRCTNLCQPVFVDRNESVKIQDGDGLYPTASIIFVEGPGTMSKDAPGPSTKPLSPILTKATVGPITGPTGRCRRYESVEGVDP